MPQNFTLAPPELRPVAPLIFSFCPLLSPNGLSDVLNDCLHRLLLISWTEKPTCQIIPQDYPTLMAGDPLKLTCKVNRVTLNIKWKKHGASDIPRAKIGARVVKKEHFISRKLSQTTVEFIPVKHTIGQAPCKRYWRCRSHELFKNWIVHKTVLISLNSLVLAACLGRPLPGRSFSGLHLLQLWQWNYKDL